MKKTLILMRHAQSGWGAGLDDHNRTLSRNGTIQAKQVGNHLKELGYIPNECLVSDAIRTKETYAYLDFDCETRYLPILYLAEFPTLIEQLKTATKQCVLIVAHNPGIAEMASALANPPPTHSRFWDFPPCSTLILEMAIENWQNVTLKCSKTIDFFTPSDLTN